VAGYQAFTNKIWNMQTGRVKPTFDAVLAIANALGITEATVKVHLKATFAPSHWAANHWRERSKAGEEVDARLINTTSPSGIYGNVGQTNYGAAKAGIAGFTLVCALELGRLGVTANCLAPTAVTRLVEPLMGGAESISDRTWMGSPIEDGGSRIADGGLRMEDRRIIKENALERRGLRSERSRSRTEKPRMWDRG
jgi:NAD(P)-dependent dehydrogenase (short-subunit alcohol dehydrogenase family)